MLYFLPVLRPEKKSPRKCFFLPWNNSLLFSVYTKICSCRSPLRGAFIETIQAGPGPPFYFFREWGYHYVETASLRGVVRAALLSVLRVQQL